MKGFRCRLLSAVQAADGAVSGSGRFHVEGLRQRRILHAELKSQARMARPAVIGMS
jgi:hypothetical protein